MKGVKGLIQRGEWQITLAERGVNVSARADMRTFGKLFSHPFLVLKAPGENVISEIHAAPKLPGGNMRLCRLVDKFTGAVHSERINEVLSYYSGSFYPKTRIFTRSGPKQYGSRLDEHPLLSGHMTEIASVWRALISTFETLNGDQRPYYRYARPDTGFTNCQIVLREALAQAGFPAPVPDLTLAQTGWTQDAETAINFRL